MSMKVAHRSYWEISETVFGIPFLIGIGMQLAAPLSLPQGVLRQALIPVGAACLVVGVSFVVLARREFARYGQPTDPGLPTSKVVTTGVFSASRNPLYLGVVGALIGVALTLNAFWVLVMLAPAIVLCHYVLIAPEERYLAAKFGEEYTMYAMSVRRWFGRRRPIERWH
ncbi:MAG TPA: isoprenylcysteine carboxylmethyltransferase family protein [Anaerolineales bacterium]